MISALLFAAVTSASLRLPTENARGCRTLTTVTSPGAKLQCCNSCSDNFLLATQWVTSTVVAHSDDLIALNETSVEVDGSGGVLLTESKRAQQSVDLTTQSRIPCGTCVRAEECLDGGGYINTWHRLCNAPPEL